MTTSTCRECTTVYAVGLPACPHCRSDDHEETGMPKITVAKGATNKKVRTTAEGWNGRWDSETNSSASTPKPPSTHEKNETDPQKPVRTTGNRSKKGRAASSSAGSATTSGPATDASSDK